MPKVGRENVSHQGLNMHYEFDVYFNKKDQFYIKLEGNLENISNNGFLAGAVYDELVRSVKSKIRAFWESTAVKPRRVIFYKIKRVLPTAAIPKHLGFDEISFATGYGLTVDWDIRYVADMPDGKKMVSESDRFSGYERERMRDLISTDYRTYQYFGYTEEREAFFKSLTEKITGVIVGITEFFGDGPEHLLKNLQSDPGRLLDKPGTDNNLIEKKNNGEG